MKEIDFLPEWYRRSKRQRVHRRRQYAVLTLIFLTMMTYNLTATHRSARATAQLNRLAGDRLEAETVLHEFSMLAKEFGELNTRADLLEFIDSRIDVAAALAEMSHVIGENILLSRVEFIADALSSTKTNRATGTTGVRPAGSAANSPKESSLGNCRFRIVLAGLAASSADVATLVCRLEDSLYFRQVYLAFSRPSKVEIPVSSLSLIHI